MQNPEWKMLINSKEQLAAMIETGIACVETNPVHHLEVGIREAIFLALSGRNDFVEKAAPVSDKGPPYSISLATEADPEKLREFWLWWLTEAVPAAANSVSDE